MTTTDIEAICHVCDKHMSGDEIAVQVRDVKRVDLPGDDNDHKKFDYAEGQRAFCEDHEDDYYARSFTFDSDERKKALRPS